MLFARVGFLTFGAVVLTVAALTSSLEAQIREKKEMEKAWGETDKVRSGLLSGEITPQKEHAKAATAMANWYLHRVTWRYADAAKNVTHINIINNDLNTAIATANDKKNFSKNRAFVNNYLAPALVESMKEVLALDLKSEPEIVINGAMLLPNIAKLRQDKVTDYLLKLVQDEQGTHDAIRVYALRALRENMPIWMQLDTNDQLLNFENFKDVGQNARRAHDTKLVDALTKYIERKVSVAGMEPGQIEAVRYLRREAIISLAQSGSPAVNALEANLARKRPALHQGLVAPTLMKVLVKGQLSPEPSLSEKIEAALGLCNMKYKDMPEYIPELGVHLVGATLVEFTNEYNKDFVKFAAARAQPYVPFRADANRFKSGLAQLRASAPTKSDAYKHAEQIEKLFVPIYAAMTNAKGYQNINNGPLTLYVPQTVPKTQGAAFKTLKNIPPLPLPTP